MKQILVLGAGRSSPYLIQRLLERGAHRDWRVTVADLDPDLAASRIAGHPAGEAVSFDAGSPERLAVLVGAADLVVNLLPPGLQPAVAEHCVEQGRSMVSVSYATDALQALGERARRAGVLLLAEVGLDPGIDHMATMALVDRVRAEGGTIEAFESYGSGVPAPDSLSNPLRYAITWDPRNVVLAGIDGAHYLRDGRLRAVPRHRVFAETWRVEVDGFGEMEAYPNRDSLAYREVFGLAGAHTLIRGTLRYPGWCEAWQQVVRLGLPDERISVPRLAERSFRDLVDMFLPDDPLGRDIEERVAAHLDLEPSHPALEKLRWLGLFSSEPCGARGRTVTDALVDLLGRRLRLPDDGRDVIVLVHRLVVRDAEPGAEAARRRVTATLIEYGEPRGVTAMARTVGLPAALAVELALDGQLDLVGCHLPTEPAIYRPILAALEAEGVAFVERSELLPAEVVPRILGAGT